MIGDTFSTTKYSEDGYQRMLRDMNGILDQFSELKEQYNALNLEVYAKYDDGDLLGKLADIITAQGNDLFTLIRNLEIYERRIQEETQKGVSEIECVEDVHCDISAFGLAAAATAATIASYASHESYQCLVESGFSFSKDFNDLQTFVNSDFYKFKNTATTGISMITDWSMWGKVISGKTDQVTYEWLESSMISVLNGMSDAAPDKITGIASWAKDASGVKNLDDWLKGVVKIAKSYVADKKSWQEFLNSEELKERIGEVFGMDEEDVREFLKAYVDEETWKLATESTDLGKVVADLEAVDNRLTQIEWIDLAFSGLSHALTDHTAQLQYLESMKKAFEENGNIYGPAYKCVKELQLQYRSSAYNMATSAWKKAKGEFFQNVSKNVIGLIPNLSAANKILSTGSTVVKLMNGKSISADKQLMGLRQYDEVLTRAFEGYTRKMQDGMATEADLQDADRLYRLLLGTKKKEYESILEIIGPKGAARGIYQDKYNELLKMEKAVADGAKASTVPVSVFLEEVSEAYHA